jgi:hypothetical protein
MLEFPYLPERIHGAVPPSLPGSARYFWRPFIPIKVHCPAGFALSLHRAVLDTGSLDTIFPLTVAQAGNIPFLPDTGHVLRWSGSVHSLRFASIELQIASRSASCRWRSTVGFSSAPLHYPLLGLAGFLEHFDAIVRGEKRIVELIPNAAFAGQIKPLP